MNTLDAIIDAKKREIDALPVISSGRAEGPSFIDAILSRRPGLIAEIKPRSPSSGHLLDRKNVSAYIKLYERHAQAISVLCDKPFFGGGFDLLSEVRTMTKMPLLAKEFILSAKQIDHAIVHGANAVLLIAAIVNVNVLMELARYAIEHGLDVLIEIHAREEVATAAQLFGALTDDEKRHIVLGINRRDLSTLTIDKGAAEALVPLSMERLPGLRCIIAESGIETREDIERLQPLVHGFLIGTSILTADDPEVCLASLFS